MTQKIEIPGQLKKENIRFVKVRKFGKGPYEHDFPNSANYSWREIQEHVNKTGENYGILAKNGLVFLDLDLMKFNCIPQEMKDSLLKALPETFTVKTPNGGLHLYYFVNGNLENNNGEYFCDTCNDKHHVFDFQGENKIVVGPGCVLKDEKTNEIKRYEILKDVEIATIRASFLQNIIEAWAEAYNVITRLSKLEKVRNELEIVKKIDNDFTNFNINVTNVMKKWSELEGKDVTLYPSGNEFCGAHPIHGSTTGRNFWINPELNCWHCFRHKTGGGPLHLIAVLEGIIDCSEALPGILRGEKFKEVLKIACERYGLELKDISFKTGQSGQSGHVDIEKILNELEDEDDDKPVNIELKYSTKHLPFYDHVADFIDLYGDEYVVIKKSAWYFILSSVLSRKGVICGSLRTDLRLNFAYPLPSGLGKHNILQAYYQLLRYYGLDVEKPTSFHPEQMVGKIERVKKKSKRSDDHSDQSDHSENFDYIDIPGWFESDVLLFNESIDLLRSTSEKYKETRIYLSQALDRWPENEVVKKLVNVPKKYAKRITPHFTCALFFQPYQLHEEIILQGFIRRFFIIYNSKLSTDFDPLDPLIKRVTGSLKDRDEIKETIKSWLSKIVEENRNILIYRIPPNSEAEKMFIAYSIDLMMLGMSFSEKCARYVNRTSFTIQERFIKMAAIHAALRGSQFIEVEDIEKAFIDALEFLWHELEFIHWKVRGEFDYGETWRGATGKDQQILEWLYNEGATSPETSEVSIAELWSKIMQFYEVSERQARRIYKRLKENGWIQTKKGRHDSKVWLTFKPIKKKRKVDVDFSKYYELCAKYEETSLLEQQNKEKELEDKTPDKQQKPSTNNDSLYSTHSTQGLTNLSQIPLNSKQISKKKRKKKIDLSRYTKGSIQNLKATLEALDFIGKDVRVKTQDFISWLQERFNLSRGKAESFKESLLISGLINNEWVNDEEWLYIQENKAEEYIEDTTSLVEEFEKINGVVEPCPQ